MPFVNSLYPLAQAQRGQIPHITTEEWRPWSLERSQAHGLLLTSPQPNQARARGRRGCLFHSTGHFNYQNEPVYSFIVSKILELALKLFLIYEYKKNKMGE